MVLTVIGARPQFVKATVVSAALREANLNECIVHTGQHYDDCMSKVFWDELRIPPYTFNLSVGSGPQGQQTAKMIERLEAFILSLEKPPACILVYGDTNSTLAGSIVASKLMIPVIHVEAGLRSFNRAMPEEINRIVTDHLAQLLFCASEKGVAQLASEGIGTNVYAVGDVMYDALLQFSDVAEQAVDKERLFSGIQANRFSVLTVHRPANTDNRENLEAILQAIEELEDTILWPVHPRVKEQLEEIHIPQNLVPVEPFSYFEMLVALRHCHKVLTDSGGLQKEAYWSKKPCITLRNETEWVETLHNGWNNVVGAEKEKIVESFRMAVDESTWKPLYGDGNSSKKIAAYIKAFLSRGSM